MKTTIIIRSAQQRDRALEVVAAIPAEPPHSVRIEPYKEKKTTQQLRLLYKWFREVRDYFGESCGKYYTDDAIKIYFKGLFGIVEVVETPAGSKKRYKSLADYTLEEMSTLMDNVYHYCSTELQLWLTSPDMQEE